MVWLPGGSTHRIAGVVLIRPHDAALSDDEWKAFL